MGLVAELHLRPRSNGVKESKQGEGKFVKVEEGIQWVIISSAGRGPCPLSCLRSGRGEKDSARITHSQALQSAAAAFHVLEQPVHAADVQLTTCKKRLISTPAGFFFGGRWSKQVALLRLVCARGDD